MPIATPEAGKDRLKAFKNKGKDQDVSIGSFHISIQHSTNKEIYSSNDNEMLYFTRFFDVQRFHELF